MPSDGHVHGCIRVVSSLVVAIQGQSTINLVVCACLEAFGYGIESGDYL